MPICIEPTHRPLTSVVVSANTHEPPSMVDITEEQLELLVQKSAVPRLADLYRKAQQQGVISPRSTYQ